MTQLYGYLANERIDSYDFPEIDDSEYKRIIEIIIQLRNRLIMPEQVTKEDIEVVLLVLSKI